MSAARRIRSLYGARDGFEIPSLEEKKISRSGGDPLYGELMPAGATRLIRDLELGPRDVFYDLGSGIGKVVLQVAMSASIKRCVGYELSATRTRMARSRLRAARREGLIIAKRCAFYTEDFLQASMNDATVVYTCATAFSDRFMRRLMRKLISLPRPMTLVSLRALDEHRRFHLQKCLYLQTNWESRCPAYVYRVEPTLG